jgi:RNA polymerase sigma-70 factor (ECF subfamily)
MLYQDILASPETPILEMLVHEERHGLVRETFQALKSKDREVLALCDIVGLQYDAVALKIGIPIGTARTRIFRARERLRKALMERDPELSMCSQTTGV